MPFMHNGADVELLFFSVKKKILLWSTRTVFLTAGGSFEKVNLLLRNVCN